MSEARRIVLAGTAGGVGTTTVTALLFDRLREQVGGAPRLLDHTAGTLGARLPGGDEARVVNDALVLHDLGRHAVPAGVAALADPATTLVVVSAATPVGCQLAAAAQQAVSQSFGAPERARTVLVLAGVFGRSSIRPQLRALAAVSAVVVVPPDPALAAGGRVPAHSVLEATHRSIAAVLEIVLPAARSVPARARPSTA